MIDTREKWWAAVDAYWIELVSIVGHHLDLMHPAFEEPGNDKSAPTGKNILTEIQYLKAARDPKLCRYFAAAWCLASEAYAWSVPGWGVFCDLCSEEWALHEESEATA